MHATASKRHERAPSTHSTYNMLNMPIFGNICSFLSLSLYGLRQASPTYMWPTYVIEASFPTSKKWAWLTH